MGHSRVVIQYVTEDNHANMPSPVRYLLRLIEDDADSRLILRCCCFFFFFFMLLPYIFADLFDAAISLSPRCRCRHTRRHDIALMPLRYYFRFSAAAADMPLLIYALMPPLRYDIITPPLMPLD